MRFVIILFIIFVISVTTTHDVCSAQDSIQVYPLQAVFISKKAEDNSAFIKSLSSSDVTIDRKLAISLYSDIFKQNFINHSDTINNTNKYNTFVAYIQIPRVSKYEIKKTKTLIDLYLPMTMSISFANMITGEIIYTYTYTYYAKYETTSDKIDNDQTITELYKETYKSLLQKVISTAKDNFKPFAINATIKKEWNGVFILDKGTKQGVVKDDTLTNTQGVSLNILYASSDYSVAKPILGTPIVGSEFSKFSNEQNLDDLKKPKVMLLSGSDVNSVPAQMIYQLFVNALGKNSAFSLISVDKSFYDLQSAVVAQTKIGNAITKQRELPEFFLKLHFDGPTYANIPSSKPDVTYDEYSIRICGDFLDISGRVLYGKCVDEKISDEIVGSIRYSKEAREEVVIKNSIIKLSDDFIKSVQFKRFELPVKPTGKQQVEIVDRSGMLQPDSNVTVFKNIGKITGIDGIVNVPTWILSVKTRDTNIVSASADFNTTESLSLPTIEDVVIVEGIVSSTKDNLKRMKFCDKNIPTDIVSQDDRLEKLIYYAVIEGLGYPLYDSDTFLKLLESLKEVGYGFKKDKSLSSTSVTDPEYCIELVTKISKEKPTDDGNSASNKCNVLAGIKVHYKNKIIWKKALQQNITISTPNGASIDYLDYEINKAICILMKDVSNKVDLNNN